MRGGEWTVTARCPKGGFHTVAVDALGRLDLPLCSCEEPPQPRPTRLRVWWEARRMRAWLRGLTTWPREEG